MKKILFVCLGNICRSPSAEGVFQRLLEDQAMIESIQVDSAGTHNYHIGSPPDPRACAAAARRDISIDALRGRQVTQSDFEDFDFILAMDKSNYSHLDRMKPVGDRPTRAHLHLFMEFARHYDETEVPDPYYGGDNGFEQVLDMLEDASQGLLQTLRKLEAKEYKQPV